MVQQGNYPRQRTRLIAIKEEKFAVFSHSCSASVLGRYKSEARRSIRKAFLVLHYFFEAAPT